MNKLKYTGFFIGLLLFGFQAFTQNYPISQYNNQTIQTCAGTFLDAGGAFANYTFNEDYTVTFCSNDPISTHIKLYFSQFNIHISDSLQLFDGPSVLSPLLGTFNNLNSPFLSPIQTTIQNASGCMTARFRSDGQFNAAGWEAQVSCITLCQQVLVAFDSLLSSHIPNDSGYIDLCNGQSVTFSGRAIFPENNLLYPQHDTSSVFLWTFGDGNTATGKVVTHLFDSVRGYNVGLKVIDDHGCMSTNSLGIRVRIAGDPVAAIAPIPEICLGDTLEVRMGSQSSDHIRIVPVYHRQTASLRYDSLTFIPDGGATGGQCYEATVEFNIFDPNQTVLDSLDILAVRVNAEHSWVGDLKFRLVCPTGQSIILKDYISVGNAHLGDANTNDCLLPWCVNQANMNPPGTGWDYTWSMTPQYGYMNDYVTLSQIDSSSYLPEESFGGLSGCPLNGIWTLEVCDYWQYDNGYVFWWQLEIDPNLIPDAWEYTVNIDSVGITGPGIVQQTDSTVLITPAVPGWHQYNLHIEDEFGCTYDSSFMVWVHALPEPQLPADTVVCHGSVFPLLQAADLGPGSAYQWLFQGIPAGNSRFLQPMQTGMYVVRVIDPNGCMAADTTLIGHAAIPAWQLHASPTQCNLPNGEAWVTGDTNLVYIWNTNPPWHGDQLTGLMPGQYHVQISDGACQYADSVWVGSLSVPSYKIAFIDRENCGQANGSASITVTGGYPPYEITWLTSPPQQGNTAYNLPSGVWDFVITDSLCLIRDSLYVGYIPGAEASFMVLPTSAEMPDPVFRFIDESGDGVVHWHWDFGDGAGISNQQHPVYRYTYPDSFLVSLFITDTAGCEDSTSRRVSVRDFLTFYMPNSFTPNGDGLNDHFGPAWHNLEVESYQMQVFNRWGKRVFLGHRLDEAWNGRVDNAGELVPPGAYIYKITMKVRHRPLQEYRGSVVIY
ncbi:MAG TPA: PKD domain-containing protein [Bacteroidales bacterium]|nr:PKD domain-containing protein [Bacteroidales bacterium]